MVSFGSKTGVNIPSRLTFAPDVKTTPTVVHVPEPGPPGQPGAPGAPGEPGPPGPEGPMPELLIDPLLVFQNRLI